MLAFGGGLVSAFVSLTIRQPALIREHESLTLASSNQQ